MYQARILDKDRQLKAILPDVRWGYTRRINEAFEQATMPVGATYQWGGRICVGILADADSKLPQ